MSTELNFFSRIWSVSLDGEPEPLPNPPRAKPYDVLYAPSGDELYITGDGGPFYALWRLDLLAKGAEPRIVRTDAWPVMRYPSFSADGKKLVYAGVRTWSNLASVPLSTDTYEPTGPPRQLTHYTNERNYSPSFSPDGRTLAFERYFENTSDVWLIDADGANARRLTTHPGEEVQPGWSQDGKRVLFGANREEHGAGLYSIDIESGEENFVFPHVRHRTGAQLSPDRTRIAFNSKKGGDGINVWVASIDDGVERQLTFDEEMMGFPSWSPDGDLIAFQLYRGSDTHIGVVPSRGGTPVQLTDEPGVRMGAAWSPDGDKIAFASWNDDVWNLYWISRTDKRERQLTDYTSLNTFVRYQAWSPLGDQIVYEYAETTGDVWMLELP